MTVIALLRQDMSHFPRGEKRVAQTLLAAYPIAGLETLAQLAERAGVSGPTVLRFLTRLGFSGFSDFQRVLHEEVHERLATVASFYEERELPGGDDAVESAFRKARENVEATVGETTLGEVRSIVELLGDARGGVLCVGGMFEEPLALYLQLQLTMLRPACRHYSASTPLLWNEVAGLSKRDIVVAFDFRRYSDPLYQACHEAVTRGARVVLFTDPWFSPIVADAAHVLVCHTESLSPFDSYAAGFTLAESIAAGLAVHLGTSAQQRIRTIESITPKVSQNPGEDF